MPQPFTVESQPGGQVLSAIGAGAVFTGDVTVGASWDSTIGLNGGIPAATNPGRGVTDWINVKASPYSAAGDGNTDDTNALQAALNAAPPGGAVYLPAGTYRVSSALAVNGAVAIAGVKGGTMAAADAASGTGTVIKPTASWSQGGAPAAGVLVLAAAATGTHVTDLFIDCSAAPASVDGISGFGAANSIAVEHVTISKPTGNGVGLYLDGAQFPDGWHMFQCLVQSAAGDGYHGQFVDSALIACHAQGCTGDGFFLTGGNTSLVGCRADECTNGYTTNAAAGGSPVPNTIDSVLLLGCRTQGNSHNGLNITNSSAVGNAGRAPVLASGCTFDGDGQNGGAGGGGYAGVAIAGSNTVTLTGCNVLANVLTGPVVVPEYALATATAGSGPTPPDVVRAAGGVWNAGTALVNNAAPASHASIKDVDGYTGGMLYESPGAPTYVPLSGRSVLTAGTVTVNNPAVTAGALIKLTTQTPGGTPGAPYVSARVAGTSFTITSTSATDTSTVGWEMTVA